MSEASPELSILALHVTAVLSRYIPLLALLSWAAVVDVRTRKIPNWLTLTVALAGLAQSLTPWAVTTLNQSVLGLLVGFGVTFLLYIIGGRGAGDVKLSAGIGAWLGVVPVLMVLAVAAVVSLVLAVSRAAARGKLLALMRSTGVMLLNVLNVRRVGARDVIASGQAESSVDFPMPNAVSMLIATMAVVIWISAAARG